MNRLGWYLEVTPSSTSYNQEITNYTAMGFVGLILMIIGIVVTLYFGRKKNKD